MSNLNKRILTSFPLLIIAIYAIYNNIILVLSLFIISSILIYEFSNIVKKIFKKNKTNSFIFLNLFIASEFQYLSISLPPFIFPNFNFSPQNVQQGKTSFSLLITSCLKGNEHRKISALCFWWRLLWMEKVLLENDSLHQLTY